VFFSLRDFFEYFLILLGQILGLQSISSNVSEGDICMKKILRFILFTGLLLSILTAACNLAVAEPVTATPALTASPTETATPAATATQSAPAVSPTPEFAPFCETGSASIAPPVQCQIPVAEESSAFCTDKKPYNLILINQGLTYEALTRGFRCSDAGTKGDKQMITCTGQMATSYEINVCDPACVVPNVQAAITQCPQDYNYNSVQGCCTREIQQLNQNCKVFKFTSSTCVANCSGIVRKSNCLKASSACQWNYEDNACEARK
jgi:hypothetical protein